MGSDSPKNTKTCVECKVWNRQRLQSRVVSTHKSTNTSWKSSRIRRFAFRPPIGLWLWTWSLWSPLSKLSSVSRFRWPFRLQRESEPNNLSFGRKGKELSRIEIQSSTREYWMKGLPSTCDVSRIECHSWRRGNRIKPEENTNEANSDPNINHSMSHMEWSDENS